MNIRHIVICTAIVVFPTHALYCNPQVASNSLSVFSVHPENYPGQLAFTDITLEAVTGGPTRKGELGGHGVMFTDVDEDGLPDLYITMIFDKPMPKFCEM